MKKNLRIVSAAAAALLAVAPVAATVAPAASTVSAAENTTYDSKLGNLNQEPYYRYNSNSIYLGTVGYKNYTEVDAVKAAIEAQVKKQLAGNSGDIKLTWGPTGTVDLTKKSYGLSFKVSRTGVKMKKNNAVKFNGKGSQYLTWTKKGNLVATEAADSEPVEFDVTVNGNATESTPSTTTPVVKPADTSSTKILNGTSVFHADANTTVTLNAVAKHGDIPSAVNGGISVSLGGENFDALLHTAGHDNNVDIYTVSKHEHVAADGLTAGHYIAVIHRATVAFGAKYANTTQKLTLTRGQFSSTGDFTANVPVDSNGVADLGEIQVPFYAYDATKEQGVHFYEVATGNVVTSGNVTLHAVNGQLTAQAVYAALNAKYGASQFRGGLDNDPDVLKPVNDIKDQLKAQNVTVDPNGYFKAPASFSINMNAKSNLNGATATLPVTVTVDNVTPTAAQETTKTVKIMHIATIYDKNGKATHEPALRAYNTVSVVSDPVTLKDEKGNDAGKFYKLAGKDQYIKVGNVDGTSRSLKHNSYVYKSTGKRRGKTVLKKGSSVTTYGKSFMIAGHQMYRIGENQYVKKANF